MRFHKSLRDYRRKNNRVSVSESLVTSWPVLLDNMNKFE
jgi:hypothetical protein